jgi:hypothetical protein
MVAFSFDATKYTPSAGSLEDEGEHERMAMPVRAS